ncbi:MAG: DMT family transporter, partial [Alphaproteobacteria bacterium]
ERAGWRRLSAIFISFIGVWVILRPDIGGIDETATIVLCASMLMAISGVLVKSLTRTELPETIVFYMSLFMLLWSALPMITSWHTFTAHQLLLVCIIALCSTIAHLCMTRAFMRTDMVVLMPFDFTRLLFTAILAYLLFGETANDNTWWGAALIVVATIYIAHREAVIRRKNAPQATE